MKNQVCIDIDGVITNFTKGIQEYSRRVFLKRIFESDLVDYALKNTCLSEQEIKRMFNDPYFYQILEPIEHVNKFLSRLNKDYKIVLVTLREKFLKDVTLEWLENYEIIYDDILFVSKPEERVKDFCFAVEDNPKIIEIFQQNKILTFVYLAPYNDFYYTKPPFLYVIDNSYYQRPERLLTILNNETLDKARVMK
jgi:uncharacterized HAD superfamily protein